MKWRHSKHQVIHLSEFSIEFISFDFMPFYADLLGWFTGSLANLRSMSSRIYHVRPSLLSLQTGEAL